MNAQRNAADIQARRWLLTAASVALTFGVLHHGEDNVGEDVVTLRIPQTITLELPRSFSFEIPKWVGYTLMAAGILTFLSIVTGGAIWHFWWLIFFVQPLCGGKAFWGKGFGCGSKRGKIGKHGWSRQSAYGWDGWGTCGWGCGKPSGRAEQSSPTEMVV